MNRYEYVTSVVLSGLVVLGAVAWTAASEQFVEQRTTTAGAPPLRVATAPAQVVATTRRKDNCRRFSQFEFKVGRVNAPNCQATRN